MNIPHYDKKVSYSDYLVWPKDENLEVIDGIPFPMSPAPSTKHQQVSINLSYILMNHFRSTPC